MHYVALLSGGKDSCFNLLHCLKNGHKLVASASLGPEQGEGEIDSFMYQTVGQDAIHLVAEALEVPLYRMTIKGKALNQDLEYGSREALATINKEDETEDLFALLSIIKENHPDISGVSIGAILSNYQRTRVEHVCQRLQLTPLCYLWQRDQEELLQEMIDSNLDAILIKIAGIGLTTRHLGTSIKEMQPTLLKLNKLYGAHICGEGGEYETLTLDCPLFKHRIILDETESVIHSDGDFAPVAYLRVKSAHLEPKPLLFSDPSIIPTPDLFTSLDTPVYNSISPSLVSCPLEPELLSRFNSQFAPHSKKVGPWVMIGNVQVNSDARTISVEDETRQCFMYLIKYLSSYSMSLTDVAYIGLFLSSMDLFSAVNSVYSTFFGRSPPARACVGVDLPKPNRLRLECIAFAGSDTTQRYCLHVQGLSYWAPANIGPYSQAIIVGQRGFVSGQIGLLPARNVLPSPSSFREELTLSLRHNRTIVETIKQTYSECRNYQMQSVITWLIDHCYVQAVQLAFSVSPWFQKFRVPVLFVVIKSLPKGALVESQVMLHSTGSAPCDDVNHADTRFLEGMINDLGVHWEISFYDTWEAFSMLIVFRSGASDVSGLRAKLVAETPLLKILERVKAIRAFCSLVVPDVIESLIHQLFSTDSMPPLTMIPSRALATQNHDEWDYALLLFG